MDDPFAELMESDDETITEENVLLQSDDNEDESEDKDESEDDDDDDDDLTSVLLS